MEFDPKPSKATISNAMGGKSSNFLEFNYQLYFHPLHPSDEETLEAMKTIYKRDGYIAEPHGAVGYLGLKKLENHPNAIGIFLETAHPIKFLDVVEPALNVKLPEQIESVMNKEKISIKIKSYEELKTF
jgi:threonine synthase